jgi:hypothetical protein
MRKSALNPFSLVVLLLAVAAIVQAQSQIHGVVQDAAGSPVASAQVLAHNSEEKTDRTILSAADGSFAIDNLKPGHYQIKATKLGFRDSPVAEQDLVAGGNLMLNLILGAHLGFFKRLSQAYAQDWQGTAASGSEPPRRALPSPLDSPPFPNSDWSYGGSPEIGAPDTNVPPLMEALYEGSNGDAWEQSRVKVYGWFEGSFNLSTSHDSNYPSAYDIFANRVEFDQGVLYVERIPDSVQTDHFDWGFHLTALYGTSYRFTTNLCWTNIAYTGSIPRSSTWIYIFRRSPRASTSALAASSPYRESKHNWLPTITSTRIHCYMRLIRLPIPVSSAHSS